MPAKIPQYYDITIRLEVDPTTYKLLLSWGKTPEQIIKDIKKGLQFHELPAPCHDVEIVSINESSENALEHRIDKITKGGAL